MKQVFASLLALSLSALSAQELPVPSPAASLEQRVGLTDISINYSRPSARERVIFGDLVPYGQIWRTGANKATSISFSTPVNFGGQKVAAGTYSLFSVPNEGAWAVMLNTETELWGANDYDEAKEVVRVEAEAFASEYKESFEISIDNISEDRAFLVLQWAEMKLMVPIEVQVREQALNNIAMAIDQSEEDKLWGVYRNAANYYYNNKIDAEKALEYIQKSVELKEDNWYSHYLHANILAELSDNKGAIKAAKKSLKIGNDAAKASGKPFSYADLLNEKIAEWKKNS